MADAAGKARMSKKNPKLCGTLITGMAALFLYLLVFALCGYYPFGNNTPVTWDLEGQYLPFMSWFSSLCQNATSHPLYTQSIPLGGGTIGLWAYYLSSPFNLLLPFFRLDTLPAAITVILLAKHAFSAMAMYFYFTVRYPRKETGGGQGTYQAELFWGLFSVVYALSGYAVNIQFNIMWLDGMIVLPLLAAALEWLVRENKSRFLVFTLCLALIANFYIGYMLWIFSFFYFLFLRLEMGTKESRFSQWRRYLGSLCISAGLCAVFLLPLIYSLSISKLSGKGIPEKIAGILNGHGRLLAAAAGCFLLLLLFSLAYGRRLLNGLARIHAKLRNNSGKKMLRKGGIFLLIVLAAGLAAGVILLSRKGIIERTLFYLPLKLFIGAFNSQEIVKGMPNIYVSGAVILCGLFFILDLRVSLREKALHCGLAGILFLSMAVKKLNVVWHGLSAPNGSNYRYSFLLSFVLIMMASYYIYHSLPAAENGENRKQKIVCAAGAAALTGWFLLSLYQYPSLGNDFLSRSEIVITIIFYLAALICYKKRPALLILVTCVELTLNAVWCLGTMSSVKWEEYRQEVNEISDIVAYIRDLDSGVYRIEIPEIGSNGAFLYGYDSISHYSSVMPAKTASFLEKFGLAPEYMGNLETIYSIDLDSGIAGLLNIKYVVSTEAPDQESYVQIASLHGYGIYENSDFQERGFLADYDMIHSDTEAASLDRWIQEASPVELSPGNDRIVCQVANESAENKLLAFSIAWDQGWEARIDGKPADTEMLWDALLCVQIPEGEHEVVLEYHVPWLKAGACVSGLTALLCAGAFFMAQRKSRKMGRPS